jgi:hypothetical protein
MRAPWLCALVLAGCAAEIEGVTYCHYAQPGCTEPCSSGSLCRFTPSGDPTMMSWSGCGGPVWRVFPGAGAGGAAACGVGGREELTIHSDQCGGVSNGGLAHCDSGDILRCGEARVPTREECERLAAHCAEATCTFDVGSAP